MVVFFSPLGLDLDYKLSQDLLIRLKNFGQGLETGDYVSACLCLNGEFVCVVCVRACVRAFVRAFVCVCVCVCERERERERALEFIILNFGEDTVDPNT